MDKLIKKQEILVEDLQNSLRNYGKDSKTRKTTQYLKRRLARVNSLWEQISINHSTLVDAAAEEKPIEAVADYISGPTFMETEEVYLLHVGELEDLISSAETSKTTLSIQNCAPSGSPGSNANIDPGAETSLKLPRISLPSFSGNYAEWTSFHDLFVALIHNKRNLSNAEKLHYLKASTHGEAARLIQGFAITDLNYETAWNILKERFDNKRMLVHVQLDKLFNQAQASENADSVKKLLDTTTESVQNLQNLDVQDIFDLMLIYIVTRKLPRDSLQLWEQQIASDNKLPSFDTLKQFLETRFRTLEAIDSTKSKPTRSIQQSKPISRIQSFVVNQTSTCAHCGKDHSLRNCPQFIALPFTEKNVIVRRSGLCINCLGRGHRASACPSRHTCIHCKKRHHSLLHVNPTKPEASPIHTTPHARDIANTTQTSVPQVQVNALHSSTHREVLLYTALITLQGTHGIQRTFRALLDPGSQSSFMTEYAVQTLALPKRRITAPIFGVGQAEVGTAETMVKTALVVPAHSFTMDVTALVLKNLTSQLPSQPITSTEWNHIQGLKLADPTFDRPGRIDVILGAEIYGSLLLPNLRKGLKGQPVAQNTILGWILSGETCREDCHSTKINTFSSIVSLTTLSQQIQKFWLVEEVPTTTKLNQEDQACETMYKTTHKRLDNGKYCVRLPFIDESHKRSLGCSRATAIGSFRSLERRFMSNPSLKDEYTTCIQEYLELGHMVPAKESDDEMTYQNNTWSCTSYYLPHHAVFKDSTSTHLRVVFDASRKSSSGYSLNDVLFTGPTLQNELTAVLNRWRKFKVVLIADIVKMYRQIMIHPDDIKYQKIIWRDSPSEPLKDYCLTTVTFGVTCAPYLAIRTIQQLAEDERDSYPVASKIALNDFYVDDLLTGADSEPEATIIYKQIETLMKHGGFKLKKWLSNSQAVLTQIPDDDKALPNSVDLSLDQGVKSLGIIRHPSSDTFSYRITISSERVVTSKRELLSEIAKLYDPLGWIAPIIVTAKILMQSLWMLGCGWDESVPPRIQQTWLTLKSQLPLLEKLRIPRWFGTTQGNIGIQLHAFSDASQNAYAAALYLRVQSPDTIINVHLIASKSKVAPIKQISIPRLELCGAVLAAKLVQHTRETLQLKHNIPIHMWTDSSIVLSWLKGQPRKWATFVANRTSEIFSLIENAPWHHVSSSDNPADLASRGVSPTELLRSSLWWNGPKWLSKNHDHWPQPEEPTDTELEAKKPVHIFHVQPICNPFLAELLTKFSSYSKLIRITAYCFRVVARANSEHLWLTSQELTKATHFWLKFHQQTYFSKDITHLQRHNTLSTDSKLLNLSPFLDKEGLLRVGGRLQNANISYDEQHPVILGKSNHLSTLIIDHFHRLSLHGGTQLTLSLLRKKFWILDGRNTVRKLLLKCIICFRLRAKLATQLMGSLPQPRVNIARPFTNTGIDYCGPINIKTSKRRGAPATKGYIAVFICLAVKAIHLELVSELSTQAFLAAFQRFVGRRGTPQHIYSDCGTNFIGANAYLKEISRQQGQFAEHVSHAGITWHFNPPHAPHFGGLWEAGVKSTKQHLRRIVGNVILTFEEMATTLCQIESCLNSRPLCPISEDPTDLNTLTPGHFLIGDALLAPPQADLVERNINHLNRWQLTQQLAQHFWKRWASEYISRLQQRPKWLQIQPNVKAGDLVLVKDDRLPPLSWPLGRVVNVYPGPDGLVRTADIKMKDSINRRPITKLARLPINDREQNTTPH